MTPNGFSEDYYLRGRSLGISLYENYSWHPEMTRPAAQAIVQHLGCRSHDTVLDFGCARGYLVRALRELRLFAYGLDISSWATGEGADQEAHPFLSHRLSGAYDWLVAKDVFEHLPVDTLAQTLIALRQRFFLGAFIVVPVSIVMNGPYAEHDEELDTTHQIRWPREVWAQLLKETWPKWSWTTLSRVVGIKDHRADSDGYGFFVGKRL